MHKVLILMSTYNGEKYIREQIESCLRQKNVDVFICIRDDGSTDSTISVIHEYINKHAPIKLYQGENLKPAKSFMWLVENCNTDKYDYFAFCDQDDVWFDNKLQCAVDKLVKECDKPSVYYCATQNTDRNLNKLNQLFTESKHTTSMIDSIAKGSLIPGCTMVFNRKLMNLLRLYTPQFLTMHDTWTHLVCLSCGGVVISDEEPHIFYRQHGNNFLGSSKGNLLYRFKRINSLNCEYSNMCIELYENYKSLINVSYCYLFEKCSKYKCSLADNLSLSIECLKSSLTITDKFLFFYKVLRKIF